MALFGFYGSCEELKSWLENQTELLRTLQPQADNLDVMQLKFEVQSPWSRGGILVAWPCCLLIYVLPPHLVPASLLFIPVPQFSMLAIVLFGKRGQRSWTGIIFIEV